MGQNANRTKYKIPKYKNDKIQILGVPIENQCVKGGGLLYGGLIEILPLSYLDQPPLHKCGHNLRL